MNGSCSSDLGMTSSSVFWTPTQRMDNVREISHQCLTGYKQQRFTESQDLNIWTAWLCESIQRPSAEVQVSSLYIIKGTCILNLDPLPLFA